MHVSVSGLRAQKSTFFGPGPALDFSRNGLRTSIFGALARTCLTAHAENRDIGITSAKTFFLTRTQKLPNSLHVLFGPSQLLATAHGTGHHHQSCCVANCKTLLLSPLALVHNSLLPDPPGLRGLLVASSPLISSGPAAKQPKPTPSPVGPKLLFNFLLEVRTFEDIYFLDPNLRSR